MSDKARTAAVSFMNQLATHRFTRAAKYLHAEVLWLGAAMTRSAWIERAKQAHGQASLEPHILGQLSSDVLSRLLSSASHEVFDGPIDADDRVVFFNVCRDGTTVTVGLLLRNGDDGTPKVLRVVDPRALKDLCGENLVSADDS
ncbi:hypothetical protein ACFL6C_00925 [Myxococcota bacterium]